MEAQITIGSLYFAGIHTHLHDADQSMATFDGHHKIKHSPLNNLKHSKKSL